MLPSLPNPPSTTPRRLPSHGRLVEGHCQIVLGEHVPSMRMTEDAAWTEVRNFKKSLVKMFLEQVRNA